MNPEVFAQIKESFQESKARKSLLEEQLLGLRAEYQSQKNREEHGEKARIIFQTVAKKTQSNLEYHISKLVTTAIRSVVPYDIEFIVRFEERRNKTECDLLFKEYGVEYRPIDGAGFGSVDVAAFAVRIAFWSLKKNRASMVLDEPFRNVSPDLQYKVSDMLQMISSKLGIQIIMVSHQEDVNLSANKTFIVSRKGKISSVKEK